MKGLVLTCWIAAWMSGSLLRESNSHAAAARGEKAYSGSRYAAAADAYAQAQAFVPSPRGAFNLGTSQIAGGDRERGSATLAQAMNDGALRANALFNRGNSALSAKAFDHAVRDYTEVLKLRPGDAAAKRNLEIALIRRQQAQRSGASGENQSQDKEKDQQQKEQAPGNQGQQQPKQGDIDLEALLRSVQQQEQEELRRMKARSGEAKVGW